MAGGKVSKNQRAGKAPEKSKAQTGDQKIMIPLNAGRHAYVRVANRTVHAPTDSEKFTAAITELGADQAPKVRAELEQLHDTYPTHGWDATLSRLEAAGVL